MNDFSNNAIKTFVPDCSKTLFFRIIEEILIQDGLLNPDNVGEFRKRSIFEINEGLDFYIESIANKGNNESLKWRYMLYRLFDRKRISDIKKAIASETL